MEQSWAKEGWETEAIFKLVQIKRHEEDDTLKNWYGTRKC